jgi:hypothetical protein
MGKNTRLAFQFLPQLDIFKTSGVRGVKLTNCTQRKMSIPFSSHHLVAARRRAWIIDA